MVVIGKALKEDDFEKILNEAITMAKIVLNLVSFTFTQPFTRKRKAVEIASIVLY